MYQINMIYRESKEKTTFQGLFLLYQLWKQVGDRSPGLEKTTHSEWARQPGPTGKHGSLGLLQARCRRKLTGLESGFHYIEDDLLPQSIWRQSLKYLTIKLCLCSWNSSKENAEKPRCLQQQRPLTRCIWWESSAGSQHSGLAPQGGNQMVSMLQWECHAL